MKYTIRFACLSHKGKCRKANQDNYICNGRYIEENCGDTAVPISGKIKSSEKAVFGVFDGMGGTTHGEKAALIAAQNASRLNLGDDVLSDLNKFCTETNTQICNFADSNHYLSTGTTAAMLAFAQNNIFLCNIGDSKIFRVADNSIEQISKDHTVKQYKGNKAPLSQNLGIPDDYFKIKPYFARGQYGDGDCYLICSDGLTDMLSIEEILEGISGNAPETAANLLLNKALEAGGKDNITIVICKIERRTAFKNILEGKGYGKKLMDKMAGVGIC